MPFTTLIDPQTLHQRLHAPDWAVVDCRFDLADPEAGRRAWQAGHIPGAVFADLEQVLSGPRQRHTGRHPLPDPDALAAWLSRHGIGNDTQVVAYDSGPGMFAARLWWLLRWLGHDAVAVLNGGLEAWRAMGGDLDDAAPERPGARFIPRPGSMPVVDTAALAREPEGWLLVDARSEERYAGESEPMDPVAGHVPGALNRPFTRNLGPDQRLQPEATLETEWRTLLAHAGGRPAAVMCGSGVTACHHLLALAHTGIEGVALYAGSWSEWIRDPERPVRRGRTP
ncbi:sulfurtransferase [Spiribacter halobius]|uniref:Sulfurtransferase n=1 Tax=Sediminicurvatus halobius TaxID=2182432 RepID=A0A2U2MZG1_9GAMM|nr:sulfurtransferase [Spiribacter halobius]PWG62198.1 sulfurtransferase [Spiribacter halobius]UEX78104.1 sulfurtransferase [Spiribacter halobius]